MLSRASRVADGPECGHPGTCTRLLSPSFGGCGEARNDRLTTSTDPSCRAPEESRSPPKGRLSQVGPATLARH
eukprot:3725608-Lingulodinium_polyedra.AAC.1